MHLEFQFTQYLRCLLKLAAVFAVSGLYGVFVYAQPQEKDLPDPIKFVNKFQTVANVVHSVLEDMGFKIEVEDRKAGRIVTRPREFITGSLTQSELAKVATVNDTATGSFVKAQYSVEALLEIVSPTETMVTIRTSIQALNRDVDGSEKWMPVDSLGSLERRILGKISTTLMMGLDTPQKDKKGFWDKSPQPVDPRQPRFPTTPSP